MLGMQSEDGPVKKGKRGRGDADSEDGAPASKAFTFGAAASASEAFGKTADPSDGEQASVGFSTPSSGLTFGANQPFSFGAAAKPDNGAKEPHASQDKAAAEAAVSQAAAKPAFLSFGAKSAEAAPDGKLDVGVKPFTPSFGAGLASFGAPEKQQNGTGNKANGKEAPLPSNIATGIPLSEVCCTPVAMCLSNELRQWIHFAPCRGGLFW